MTHYITTAIPYVNAAPHLGHALEAVQADSLARYWRQAGHDVRYLSGTDDYALTNVLAAEAAGQSVTDFVAERSADFERLKGALSLSFDDYIKTSTDPRHRPGVERLWNSVDQSGDLYRKAYVGLYCARCEAFYEADQLDGDLCPDHQLPVEEVAEENWFFRLSRYADQLADAVESGALRIEPEPRRNEVLGFIRSGLKDVSVSRTSRRARGWGIPVPGDSGQVIYVWFDALGNYITALGYGSGDRPYDRWWRESDRRVHVIGKGILRFHAVHWPAFLLSVGEPLPTDILVHDYIRVAGAAMSKTRGNVVDPFDLIDRFGTTRVRWWCASAVRHVGETEFAEDALIAAANRDLAGGFGNLVARLAGLPGVSGERRSDGELDESVEEARAGLGRAVERLDLSAAAGSLKELLSSINRYIEEHRPWEGRARPTVIATARAATAAAIDLLQPLVPDLAERAHSRLIGAATGPAIDRIN